MSVDQIVRAFGDRFARYALNIASFDSPLTQAQEMGVAELTPISYQIISDATPSQRNDTRRRFIAYTFSGPLEMGPVSQVRAKCGAPPPVNDEPDVVKRHLYRLLYEMYPLTLVDYEPALDDPFGMERVSAAFAFECAESLARAVLDDPDLSKLFPGEWGIPTDLEALCDVIVTMTWLSGSSSTEQLVLLPESLASFALNMGAIHGVREYHDYLPFGSIAVDKARLLAVGQDVSVPLVVGLSNITLEEDISVAFGLGKARNAELRTSGILHGAASRGPSTIISALEVPERLLDVVPGVSTDDRLDAHMSEIVKRSETIWDSINRSSYAFILASREDRVLAPQIDGFTELNPISSGPPQFIGYRSPTTFGSAMVSAADARTIEAIFRDIQTSHPQSMNVTLKRLVSAVSRRNDTLDAFIDAVMCWENMFSGAPETTFKVCGSLACLLEPEDIDKRTALFKKLKKLYTARSNLVHGGREPSTVDAVDMKNYAVWVAIQAVKRVYRREDLRDCADADARHQRLLIGI